jgi:hypothetical protein
MSLETIAAKSAEQRVRGGRNAASKLFMLP